jgi:hypothetical protein
LGNEPKLEESVAHFTALYWGDMIFVEDHDVRSALTAFALEIKDYQGGWSGPENLKLKANNLIEACRRSAEKGSPDI